MPRTLQDLLVELLFDPDDLAVREAAPHEPAVSSAEDLLWRLPRVRDAAVGWRPYVTLAGEGSLGGFVVDDDFGPGDRTVRTPYLSASKLRAWRGVEVLADVPAGTSLEVRLARPGAGDLAHDGAAWVDADGGWNTIAELEAAFGDLSPTIRAVAVRFRLATTTPAAAPKVFGARFAYGVAWRSAADDALLRTLLPFVRTLRLETEIEEVSDASTTTSFGAGGSSDVVEEVFAVYDLDDDPDEEAPLAGALAANVWTFATAPTTGHRIRYDVRVVPDVIVRRHPKAEALRRLPAVYVDFGGVRREVRAPRGFPYGLTGANPGRAPAASYVEADLDVLVLAAYADDDERLGGALDALLGSGRGRCLLSTESGLPVVVRADGAIIEGAEAVASGIAQARGAWTLGFLLPTATTIEPLDVVETIETEDPP